MRSEPEPFGGFQCGRRACLLMLLLCGFVLAQCKSQPGRKDSVATDAPEATFERAPESPPDGRPIIVAFGDSLTAGLGVAMEENYPSKVQRKLDGAGYAYRVVNAGVSGDTTAQGLNRLPAVLDMRPALVVVALGGNDGLRGLPVETTRANLAAIIRLAQREGAKVVLAGMMMPPNYGPEYTRSFQSIFPELAKEYRVPLVPFLLAGVAGIPDLNQGDGIHPNARGYDIVAENVWTVLERQL